MVTISHNLTVAGTFQDNASIAGALDVTGDNNTNGWM